jgi:hypothetical protein
MKKRIISMLIAVAMIISVMPTVTVSAEVFTGDGWSYESVTETLTVTTNDGTTNWRQPMGANALFGLRDVKTIVITNSVTEIGDSAFSHASGIMSINIPDSVTSIGNHAFGNCWNLESLTIPSSVTNIGDNAFYVCSSLKEITVSENNPAYASENGVLFNKSKTMLIRYPADNPRTEYTVPDSVTYIGEYAFDRCNNLESVIIPDSVIDIGRWAFNRSSATSVIIGNGVKSIGSAAFSNSKLKTLTLGNSVESIGDVAFWDCLLESVTIPPSVVNIGRDAFGANFPNFTIHCKLGSPAHIYAIRNDIWVVLVDSENIRVEFPVGITDTQLVQMIADGRIPKNVTILEFGFNNITNLAPLAGLTDLKSLYLTPRKGDSSIMPCGKISDISVLLSLNNLENIMITVCKIPLNQRNELKNKLGNGAFFVGCANNCNFTFAPGLILQTSVDSGKTTIGDALEVLKFLAGLPNVITSNGRDSRQWKAACITGGDKPVIGDALEILKKLAGLPSLVTN